MGPEASFGDSSIISENRTSSPLLAAVRCLTARLAAGIAAAFHGPGCGWESIGDVEEGWCAGRVICGSEKFLI